MKTQVIKVQNPKIIGGYKYYLLIINEKEPEKRMVIKITEKQANQFIEIQKK